MWVNNHNRITIGCFLKKFLGNLELHAEKFLKLYVDKRNNPISAKRFGSNLIAAVFSDKCCSFDVDVSFFAVLFEVGDA